MVAASLTPMLRSRRQTAAETRRTLSASEIRRLAQPCDHDPRGTHPPKGVYHRHLPELAADLAVVYERGYAAAQGPIDCSGCAAGRGNPLKEVDDDCADLLTGNVSRFDLDLHNGSFECGRCRSCAPQGNRI